MMGYDELFWGLLFFFDLRINGFDILPNFIGYILIYNGLKKLSDRNVNFKSAKSIAFPLIFLSIPGIYQIQTSAYAAFSSPSIIFSAAIGIILTILNIILIYRICMGIAEEAGKRMNSELEAKAILRWKLYMTYCITFTLLFFIPILLVVLFIPLFIFCVIVLILLMSLMKEASNSL